MAGLPAQPRRECLTASLRLTRGPDRISPHHHGRSYRARKPYPAPAPHVEAPACSEHVHGLGILLGGHTTDTRASGLPADTGIEMNRAGTLSRGGGDSCSAANKVWHHPS